ncbi:hypothetical protein B0H17DRAFT_1199648 [Mycena rosella]|uniref:Uncharacterized protein n=1 Tax=Mycena rosella TaxID=1033263 RepID=A0AAD7DJX3_MYCRO|nr:hypothetical protein B0H17DRAFT_1199648 [Mycena rosella]
MTLRRPLRHEGDPLSRTFFVAEIPRLVQTREINFLSCLVPLRPLTAKKPSVNGLFLVATFRGTYRKINSSRGKSSVPQPAGTEEVATYFQTKALIYQSVPRG